MLLTSRRQATLVALVSTLFACACAGDDAGESTPSLVSGLAQDTQLWSLSAQDTLNLCHVTAEAVGDVLSREEQLQIACTLQATFFAIKVDASGVRRLDQQACEASRDECLVSVREQASTTATSTEYTCDGAKQAMSCRATVGEYEGCVNARLRAARATAELFDCARLAREPVAASVTKLPAPLDAPVPECDSFEAKCGDLDLSDI